MSIARELARLNEEYIQGMMNGDAGWFEDHLADELICIESDGSIRNKTAFVRKITDGPAFRTYRLDEVQVRVYGEVALVRATGTFTRRDGKTGASRYTDVYVRANRDWRVVSAQVTGTPAPAEQTS
jgi:ketosteroid isomerase-like protein